MNKIINNLIVLLTIIAGMVAVGLIAGYSMYPFIVAYWIVLLMKNLCDWIKKRNDDRKEGEKTV